MKTILELPHALEGEWILRYGDGKVIATSKEHFNATVTIAPYFYEGLSMQTIARITTNGGKGRDVKQMARVHASNGKVQAVELDKPRKRVSARFDELGPLKASNRKVANNEQ